MSEWSPEECSSTVTSSAHAHHQVASYDHLERHHTDDMVDRNAQRADDHIQCVGYVCGFYARVHAVSALRKIQGKSTRCLHNYLSRM